MLRVNISHLEESDIPARIALLYEPVVQKNLNAITLAYSADELTAIHRRTIAVDHYEKRFFKLSFTSDQLIGYSWITDIDWVGQTCELSIAILPRFRIGYGLIGLVTMYDYLYDTLNLRVIVNQILEGNEMLQSQASTAALAQVTSPRDSFTCGSFRTTYYWTQTRDDYIESQRRWQQRRRSRAAGFEQIENRVARLSDGCK